MAACEGAGMTNEALMNSLDVECKPRRCEELLRRSNPVFSCAGGLDCFASLAMTTADRRLIKTLSRGADRRQGQRSGVAVLQAEERGVAAAAPQQIVMAAALDDLAAFDHQNGVGVHDGVQ